MAPAFTHLPLQHDDSVRVLRLYGSSTLDAEIHCDIIHTDLHNPPLYEAVSYTWQDQNADQVISVGHSSLAVTHNCQAALRYLRPSQEDASRVLWIDIVCIDQTANSFSEKSHQVKLMGKIFASAQRVLAWLGPWPVAKESCDRHLRAASWMSQLAEASTIAESEEKMTEIRRLIGIAVVEDLLAFSREIPWRKRLWTVQEVTLATRTSMIYGTHEIQLQRLIAGRELVEAVAAENPGGKGHEVGPQLHDMFATHHKVLRPDKFTAIMEQMRYSKTKLPHDNVFAIYTILRNQGLNISEPDYMKPVAEVYRETAVAMIQTEGYRDLFFQIGLPKSAQDPEFSSRVPDWSHNKYVKECTQMLRKHKGATLASGPEFRFDNNHRHLVIRGSVIDEIAERSGFSLLHGHSGLGPSTEEFKLNQEPPHELWSIYEDDMQSHFTETAAVWNIRAIRSFLIFAGFQNKESWLDRVTVLFRSLHSMSWDLSALENDSASLRRLCTLILSASSSGATATSSGKTSSSAAEPNRLQLLRDSATMYVPELMLC